MVDLPESNNVKGPVLVTGGAGFIGSNLVRHLLLMGYRVIVIDNFDAYYSKKVKYQNLEGLRTHPKLQVFESDLRDIDKIITFL